uniref:Replication-associated protein n=1 Tax=Circoviridae sp. TaxID=1954248 RepID=A0A890V2G1_9VIRU|nr:MAG: replication-associated protein [Circoviridae sp.]
MAPQARYWLLTIPHPDFIPYLPPNVAYVKGQLEQGNGTGYLHWQLVAYFRKPVRLGTVKGIFGDGIHAESTKSQAAEDYVWKEDTRVEGTQFELGEIPFNRGKSTDWSAVWENAQQGRLLDVPADVRIRCYNTLKRIRKDYTAPAFRPEIRAKVFVI